MKKNRYSHGGYNPFKSKAEKYGDGNLDELEKNRPIFRGFVGGDSFVTKKGYRGMKLDSMWVQSIFDAMKTDDEELAQIALQSQLADLKDVVVGGNQGAPFSIGDYGFFGKNQFEDQAKLLSSSERQKSKASSYLSSMEWDTVDEKLSTIAHHGTARFLLAHRGDSFCALAIRQNAYKVAQVFMNAGIDPLISNEEGHDIFEVVKQQYGFLGNQLKEVQGLKDKAKTTILVPSEVQALLDRESNLTVELQNLSSFADAVKDNLEKRLSDIENDKIIQRRLQLRRMEVPKEKMWNIEQQSKVELYIQEIAELKQYVDERLRFQSQQAAEFENLADLLQANIDLILTDEQSSENRDLLLITDASSHSTDDNRSASSRLLLEDAATGDFSSSDRGSIRLPAITDNNSSSSGRASSRQLVTTMTVTGELEPIAEQDEDEADDGRRSLQSKDANSAVLALPPSRAEIDSSNRVFTAFSESSRDSSSHTTPRSALVGGSQRKFSSKSHKSRKAPERLSSKQELFERLGITKAVSIEKSSNSNSAASSPMKSNSPMKTPNKLMGSNTAQDEYLPVIGTLFQSEHSITLYR